VVILIFAIRSAVPSSNFDTQSRISDTVFQITGS
jgi:hypothetical protein